MKTKQLSVSELEKFLNVSIHPNNQKTAYQTVIEGLCAVEVPRANHLVFIEKIQKLGDYDVVLEIARQVAVMLIDQTLENRLPSDVFNKTCVILVPNAKKYFIKLLDYFNPYKESHKELTAFTEDAIIEKTAAEERTCQIGSDFSLGPHCMHGKDVVIQDGVTLMGGNVIGSHVVLGSHVTLYPNVVLYPGTVIGDHSVIHAGTVIGSDGFGYHPTDKGIHKIPQIGYVKIGSRVEIGANVTIDRATLEVTELGDDVKIDNLVQIAHNVRIGAGSIVAAQTGIAGSSVLGRGVLLAGQVGVADHTTLGDGVRVGAQSGIMPRAHISPGKTLMGSPALTYREFFRRENFLNKAFKENI